jgi:hypothetical protein
MYGSVAFRSAAAPTPARCVVRAHVAARAAGIVVPIKINALSCAAGRIVSHGCWADATLQGAAATIRRFAALEAEFLTGRRDASRFRRSILALAGGGPHRQQVFQLAAIATHGLAVQAVPAHPMPEVLCMNPRFPPGSGRIVAQGRDAGCGGYWFPPAPG